MRTHPFIIKMYENALLEKHISLPWNNIILFSALHDLRILGERNILNGLLSLLILSLQKNYLLTSTNFYKKWAYDFISMFLVFTYWIWKVRCNIIHDKISDEVYSDKENVYHAIIHELLSTSISSISIHQRYIFN